MFTTPLRYCGSMKNINCVLAIGNSNIGQIISSMGRVHYSSDKGSKSGKDLCQTEQGKRVEPWPKVEPSQLTTRWRSECSHEPQPPNYDPYRIKVPDVVVPPLPPSNAKPALECAKIKGPCSVPKAPDPPPCPPPPSRPFPWIYVYMAGAFFTAMGLLKVQYLELAVFRGAQHYPNQNSPLMFGSAQMIYRFWIWKQHQDLVSDSKPVWRPRANVKSPGSDRDLPPCVQYLIVGTGAAGWAAYEAIMKHDQKAKVFFITKDDSLPYERPPMSKHMWWTEEPPDIDKLYYTMDGKRYTMLKADCSMFMDPVQFCKIKEGPAVSLASGWCVLRVDADEHAVYVQTLCGEQPIYYQRCLLAPGSTAKNLDLFKSAPKAVRDKVSTMRNIRDLEDAFRKVRAAQHVVILGGGVLGTELAWYLGRMKKVLASEPESEQTEYVHMYKDPGILAGILPEYLGEWAAEKIRCERVSLMSRTQVYDAFPTPDGRLQLTLSNGKSLVTDHVLVAIGAEPREELAVPSFLERDIINGGFLVNTELEARTHLYVAGDAASLYTPWKDTRVRFEHYQNAMETGSVAGANMTGEWETSSMESHFWLKLGKGLQMEVVGEVGACMPTIALFKQCPDEENPKPTPPKTGAGDQPCFKKSDEYKNRYKRGLLFYLRDEFIVGMVFWNIPPVDDRKEVVTEILRAQPTYKDINLIAELLGFPETKCTYRKKVAGAEEAVCFKNFKTY